MDNNNEHEERSQENQEGYALKVPGSLTHLDVAEDNNLTPAASKDESGMDLEIDADSDRRAACVSHKNMLLDRLGSKIDELIDFVKDRHNVHKQIKDLARSIRASYRNLCTADDNLQQCQRPGTLGKETQTTPSLRPQKAGTAKEAPITPQDKNRANKEKDGQPKKAAWQEVVTRKSKKKDKEKSQENKNVPSVTKQKKPPRARPTRPEALVIKAAQGSSYAEVLRKMKAEPRLKMLGDSVNRVRRTAAGDLLLELRQVAEEVLEVGSTIRTLQDTEVFEIKDLDVLTTKEEIVEALQREYQDCGATKVNEAAVKSVRKAYGDTQIAVIQMPAQMARQMIAKQKIRIGWVFCRIREVKRGTRPCRCYKCLGFGHIAKNCTAAQDRSKCCYRCGSTEHKVINCSSQPKCVLCHERGAEGKSDHAAGSYTCPAYQAALTELKNRRK